MTTEKQDPKAMATTNNDAPADPDTAAENTKPDSENDKVVWASEVGRQRPSFMTRMITDMRQDPYSNYDTFNKLMRVDKSMAVGQQQSASPTSKKKAGLHRFDHSAWLISTVICLVFLVLEMIYMFTGIAYLNHCAHIDVYLIISAFFHILIILLEWLRRWILNMKGHRDSRLRVDLFQLTSAVMLVMLYIFSVIWYSIGLAWIMVPYIDSLFKDRGQQEIIVHIRNTTTIYKETFCSRTFYHTAIFYQVYVLVIFLARFVMCGFGDFCRGLCLRFINDSGEFNVVQSTIIANNEISDSLPPISSYRISGFRGISRIRDSFFPRNIHANFDCMISNIPEWRPLNV